MNVSDFSYALFLLGLGLLVVSITFPSQLKDKDELLLIFFLGYSVRVVLFFLNVEFNFFEEKLAGILSLYNFQGTINNSNFFFQTLLNYFGFTFFGENREIIVLTNCLVGTLISFSIYFFSSKVLQNRQAKVILCTILFSPAIINFSIFGLRDIILVLGCSVFIYSFINFLFSKIGSLRFFVSSFISLIVFVSLLSQRPENTGFLVAFGITLKLFYSFRIICSKQRKTSSDRAGVYTFILIILLLIPAVGMYGYTSSVKSFGFSTQELSPNDLAGQLAEARYNRANRGDGGGSNLLPPSIYNKLPLPIRYIVQVAGLIVLPFPWMINSPAKALAFLDSLLFIFLLREAFKNRRFVFRSGNIELESVYTACLVSVCVYLLAVGLLVSNAGNGFRVRIFAYPFLYYGYITSLACKNLVSHRRALNSRIKARVEAL